MWEERGNRLSLFIRFVEGLRVLCPSCLRLLLLAVGNTRKGRPYPNRSSYHLVVMSVLRIPLSLSELVNHNAVNPVTNRSHVAPNTSRKIVERFNP